MSEYTVVGPRIINVFLREFIATGIWREQDGFVNSENGCLFILLYEFS